jgi:hypothetical protein
VTVARAVVAVVAILLIAWLAVMERDARLLERGVQTSGRGHIPGNPERAEKAFRDARVLNPDTEPDLGRAFLYFGTNRRARARALVEDVLRREPDNLTAWGLLFRVANEVDPAGARRALAARRRLDPLSARRRP